MLAPWFGFALLSSLLFALVHVADARFVNDVFGRPCLGVVAHGLGTLLWVVIPLTAWQALHGALPMPWSLLGLSVAAGLALQASHRLYFEALTETEPGVVAAYWNLVPALLVAASFTPLSPWVGVRPALGALVLVVASLALGCVDRRSGAGWRACGRMGGAALLHASTYLAQDHVFASVPFTQGMLWVGVGLAVGGLAPMALRSVRRSVRDVAPKLRAAAPWILSLSLIDIAALVCAQRAVDVGPPALVAAVEATLPAFTLAGSLLLAGRVRTTGPAVGGRWLAKVGLVGVMTAGVWLVA